MSAHRFWRLRAECRQLAGGFVFALAEFEARTAPGGSNLCTGGVPYVPMATDPGFSAGAAFDGDSATFYARGGNNQIWFGYDFGTAVDVGEVRLKFGATGSARPGSDYSPAATTIDYSDDGVQWYATAPLLDLTAVGDGGTAVFLLADVTARAGGQSWRLVDPGVSGAAEARTPAAPWRHDTADGGAYRVAGTVKIDGTPAVPVRRRVRLFHRLTGRLVRETWSGADGTFAFERVARDTYLVIADDYTGVYEAEAADRVLAVL